MTLHTGSSLPVRVLEEEHGNIRASLQYLFDRAELKKSDRICDIGCRYGSLIYNLWLRGFENVCGLDVNTDALDSGRAAYPSLASALVHFDGEHLPFPSQSFDVILMFDVIEHIPNPVAFLRKVRRMLKPDGRLVFQTPNILINILWEIINQRSLSAWRRYHCSLQSLDSLRSLLKATGFCDIVIEKHEILTEHNLKKVRRKLGPLGQYALRAAQNLPLPASPNFYGHCRK